MSFRKYMELYITALPLMSLYSTMVGINIGIKKSEEEKNSIDMYSAIIGYTGIGIMTGITYPISYPLFGSYVLYKNRK